VAPMHIRSLVPGLVASLLSVGLLHAQPTWSIRYFEPPPAAYWVRTVDIPYGANTNPWTSQNEVLKLDLYEPLGDTEQARPVYVHIHGGQYYYGTKQNGEAEFLCKGFADLGFVAVSIDYRLAPTSNTGSLGPDTCAEDAKAAMRWLRKNAATYRIDPNRIFLGGDSAGGTSAFIASYTAWEGNSGTPGYSSTPNMCLGLWAFCYTPITNKNVPLLLVHGTADLAIAYSWSQYTQSLAQQNGVPCTLIPVIGGPHEPWNQPSGQWWDQWKVAFWGMVYEYLNLGQRSGCVLNDYKTSNQFVFSITGHEDNFGALVVSVGTNNLPLPGLGTLQIDPWTSVSLGYVNHPAGTYVTTKQLAFPKPASAIGTCYAQVFELANGNQALRRLSNGLTIQLP
jgi:dienelactone hydrolase